ncbi:MAG: hypothetical protein H0U50_05490 [Pyrinomonadaceae bacterium]|nr:hypothetical protein [Pyrinomonadaceae bacterium]
MPTQQEIDNLHNSLTTRAQIIQTKVGFTAQKAMEKQEAQDAKELRRAQLQSPIAADRITYTNDAARLSALMEQTADDVVYQTELQNEYTATTAKTISEAEVELNRKLYRADELLLLYYANNPTATSGTR